MRITFLFLSFLLLFTSCNEECAHETSLLFPSYAKARNIITHDTHFSYYERVTESEMKLQLGDYSDSEPLKETFKRATASSVVKPNIHIQEKLDNALKDVICKLGNINPAIIPENINIVIIDGSLMGESTFYTRGNTIFCPLPEIENWSMKDRRLKDVIAHEVFHIISRNNKELREELYAELGYFNIDTWKPANNRHVSIPSSISKHRIINPDEAPTHYVYPISSDKALINFLTVDTSKITTSYTEGISWNLYEMLYINNMFVINENPAQEKDISTSLREILPHTDYIIHPEEMSADLFAIILYEGTGRNDLLKSVEKIIQGYK